MMLPPIRAVRHSDGPPNTTSVAPALRLRSAPKPWPIIRSLALVAILGLPTGLAAQETQPPAMPAPDISSNAPAIPAPDAPVVNGGLATPDGVDSSAPDLELETPDLTTGNGEPAPLTESPADVPQDMILAAQDATWEAAAFLGNGGPSLWAIAALSVVTLALILWKIWRLALIGAWSRGQAGRAVDLFESGQGDAALAVVNGRRGIRSVVVFAALKAMTTMSDDRAREETARVAKREIGNAGTGLRALELIATIAPLLGLLGTVLGMIAAFQALQQAGNRADPALLAGGIWEALLTTAAGMAVAIPASAALTWFEAVIERIRRDVEDGATRLFLAAPSDQLKLAAE